MSTNNHIGGNFGQSHREVQGDGYNRSGVSSRVFANRGGHVGRTFQNRSYVPAQENTPDQDHHPNDPAFHTSAPLIRFPSRQATDEYLSHLPVRGRYNYITCITRNITGTRVKTNGGSSALSTVPEVSPSKFTESSAYYVDPEMLSTFRQQSDDATLTHAAMAYVDKNQPKKKTKAQIDREADATERQVIRDATYRVKEAMRQLNVARKAVRTAKDDKETVLMAMQYAEKAAKTAKDDLNALKQARLDHQNAEFLQLVADHKRRAAEGPRPIRFDVNSSIGGVPSDTESSEEEETEDDVVTEEEVVDIAYADGLTSPPTHVTPSVPYVADDEISCFRVMTEYSERLSKEQKKARSKDLIHRAELNKLKLQKQRAIRKQKAKKNVGSSSKPPNDDVSTPMVAAEDSDPPHVAGFDDPSSDEVDAFDEEPAPTSSSLPKSSRIRRFVVRTNTGKTVIRSARPAKPNKSPSSSPLPRPECNLEDFVEDDDVCRFLQPWFDHLQVNVESGSSASGDHLPLKKHKVIEFLETVSNAVNKAKDPLLIGRSKVEEVMGSRNTE
uniref:ULP_PROTEASE domain-containing protein n=1 Tax=Panagrellus redivivus TaxID=6233 RepID=A0A7E4W4X7_PANRE